MPLLDDAEIRELVAAVLSANLAGSRGALLAGVDPAVVASLEVVPRPADQVMRDLDALSSTGALLDGKVPLHTWLANAAHLAGPRREASVFARYRDRVAPAVRPAAVAAPPAMTEGQLLDALCNLLPAMFESFVFKLEVPPAYLSATTAPQATRAVEVLRWAGQAGRMADASRVLAEVRGGRR